jgi:hypothetical protein
MPSVRASGHAAACQDVVVLGLIRRIVRTREADMSGAWSQSQLQVLHIR